MATKDASTIQTAGIRFVRGVNGISEETEPSRKLSSEINEEQWSFKPFKLVWSLKQNKESEQNQTGV